jgi:hypothetical protein
MSVAYRSPRFDVLPSMPGSINYASLSADYVVAEQCIREGHAPNATVEQSSIEAKSTDQLGIRPLLGDK